MASWFRAARNASRKVPPWAVGVAVATPLAAILQGGLMLQQYRRDHGHAPRPISPSQGLVVVSSNNNTASKETTNNNNNDTRKPLRLLVIGDSLAAGVGVSSSGTPILPQSIARALSGASNGRAVHWTCIGTPGASASQVVHDLGAYQDTPSLLERKHVEWQVATRKAKEWWQQRKALEEERKLEETTEKNRVKLWWSRFRKDVQQIKLVVLQDIPKEVALQSKLTRRKTTLDPDVVAQYDIAVVLTGINDLKDAFLPFMRMRKNAPSSNGESTSMRDALVDIIHALQSKMKLNLPKDDSDAEKEDESTVRVATSPAKNSDEQQQLHRGPLVVFPGMPAAPLPLTHYPPLSWFLIPLIEMMDNNKRMLAQSFPGLVLYVDPPSAAEFRAIESGRGEVYESRRAEQVLLQLTNVTQRAQEKVKELMEQHYSGNNTAAPVASDDTEEDERMVYGQGCRDHQLVEPQHTPGATLIAEDRVHPNDAGYDFFGRHIAAAIIREWEQEER